MSPPVRSNKFLNATLRAVAASVIAATEAVEAAIHPLEVLLTHRVSGQSPDGVNPTCEDVFNQVDLPTVELVDQAMVKVAEASKRVSDLHRRVYPRIHQTHWERRRQSPTHQANTGPYVPPPV